MLDYRHRLASYQLITQNDATYYIANSKFHGGASYLQRAASSLLLSQLWLAQLFVIAKAQYLGLTWA